MHARAELLPDAGDVALVAAREQYLGAALYKPSHGRQAHAVGPADDDRLLSLIVAHVRFLSVQQ